MMRKLLAIAASVVVLVGCRGNDPAPTAPQQTAVAEAGSPLVARFGELEITAAEVDARVLSLPPSERPKPGQDLDAWYREQIRELAVEHGLRAEASASRLAEEPEFLAARREAEKQVQLQLCLAKHRPELAETAAVEISQADLRAAYDAHAEALLLPERRSVYNLFRRRRPDVAPAAARAEIEALRDRVLAGENFRRLASERSDSESRHKEGSLGWFLPGQLPAGFEKVIFSLEEGVPSEPVATRDGYHLFYVDQILPARRRAFEEVRGELRTLLVSQRREAALDALAAEAKPPAGAKVLDREGLAAVIEAGDPEAVVLSLGDVTLTFGELRRQLRQTLGGQAGGKKGRSRQGATLDTAWQLLDRLRRRELIVQQCVAEGLVAPTEVEIRLAAWQRDALLAAQRQRRLIAIAERDEARLRLFYQSNVGLFSQPPKWQLRRLTIPIGSDASTAMARLERAASEQGEGARATSLEELHAELGGEIEDLGTKSQPELYQLAPKLPPLVASLETGALSAPYRTQDALEIVQVVSRREGEPLAFEEIRQRVAATYVGQYAREVYQELSEEILATAKLEISPDGLAALRKGGLSTTAPGGRPPAGEISVEELEELLDEV